MSDLKATKTSYRAPRRCPREQTWKPRLEVLEDRLVPAGGLVSYYGGPLVSNIQVQAIYYKPPANDAQPNLQAQFDPYLSYLASSQSGFTQMLSQYSAGGYTIGSGKGYTGDANVTAPIVQGVIHQDPNDPTSPIVYSGPVIYDSAIQQTISAEIAAGRAIANNPNSVYVVFTPKNVAVVDPNFFGSTITSVNDFRGYHFDFTDPNSGQEVNYVVIPYSDSKGTLPAAPGLTGFQTEQGIISHELAETITDPQADQGSGWGDVSATNEIADLEESRGPNGTVIFPHSTLNGYIVQDIYNNQTGTAMRSADTNFAISQFSPDLYAINGEAFGPIFQFYDTNFSPCLDTFQATVNWGDGTTSSTTDHTPSIFIVPVGNDQFQVWGVHQYSSTYTAANAPQLNLQGSVTDLRNNHEYQSAFGVGAVPNDANGPVIDDGLTTLHNYSLGRIVGGVNITNLFSQAAATLKTVPTGSVSSAHSTPSTNASRLPPAVAAEISLLGHAFVDLQIASAAFPSANINSVLTPVVLESIATIMQTL